MDDNEYEQERRKIIAENQALLGSLGLNEGGSARINIPAPVKPVASRKRKERPVKVEDEGPRRRSGRLAGLELDTEAMAAKVEEEAKQMEVQRVINRKIRDQVMPVNSMVEDTPERMITELDALLESVGKEENPRVYPSSKSSAKDAYAEDDKLSAEVQRLKSAFSNMVLQANTKVTSERVFSMVVHPEKTKTLVLVGDKYGQLGIWDAMGPAPEQGDDEDEYDGTGRVWRVQAHARNSISCMKVDPSAGSSLISSAYDCSLRQLDFNTLTSTELFAFTDEDLLISHFDLIPEGREAWITDHKGGISHCDFREPNGERRRWVVEEEGRAAKLGGVSVNPTMPHLLCTAGNDRHVRIWDTRHLDKLKPKATEALSGPEDDEIKRELETYPTSSIPYDRMEAYMATPKGKGLQRAAFAHGKSCSAAYWDPWGRRVLTTSYDDKLRIFTLNPQSFMLDAPVQNFKPSKVVPHDCQTGRWLTILRAQWSLNTDYMPHFTVGNMKRRLDVIAATGDKIVSLWTDGVTAVPTVTASHPSHATTLVGGNTSGRIQLWTAGDE